MGAKPAKPYGGEYAVNARRRRRVLWQRNERIA